MLCTPLLRSFFSKKKKKLRIRCCFTYPPYIKIIMLTNNFSRNTVKKKNEKDNIVYNYGFRKNSIGTRYSLLNVYYYRDHGYVVGFFVLPFFFSVVLLPSPLYPVRLIFVFILPYERFLRGFIYSTLYLLRDCTGVGWCIFLRSYDFDFRS
jgi:hypothetical protein